MAGKIKSKTKIVWAAIGIIALVIVIGVAGFIYLSPGQTIFPHARGIGTEPTTQQQPSQEQLTVRFSSGGTVHNAQMAGLGSNAVSYLWDFGDGATSTERNPTHTYEKAGTYTVTLAITLDTGEEYTESTTISVG